MRSDVVCVESCAVYELPNTFTPNQDGSNDNFIPRENRFVSSVDFKVFNRWGNLLFSTTDPMLNWDGRSDDGQELSEGTYYYTCSVFEGSIELGIVETDLLSGFIELLR